ncbi:hypothetical protein [Kitasatospora brasiliensis]|uniref:hypothetical protein n=1 Tax=Kitasatospora brasiliensis TaxID=3058040 RepID=UPI0029311479|nr:hypothetical protein [Kitasatospora sp. K002]
MVLAVGSGSRSEEALVVDPILKATLVRLRAVKSQRPADANPGEFVDWGEKIADCLDAVAIVPPFAADQKDADVRAD